MSGLARACFAGALAALGAAAQRADVWISSEDGRYRLTRGEAVVFEADREKAAGARVDAGAIFQTMLGFGSSLEPASCFNLSRLPLDRRREALSRLVDPARGIGMNLMRVSMGTPDFTGDPWYSYDDMPPGRTDPELRHFSIEKDRAYILPVLKLARETNPKLLFFASPWSPPGWMKSTGDMIGGYLLPEHYDAYARYFVRFIEEYEKEGIPIYAATVQNEPGVDRSKGDPKWRYPSCHFTAEQEREFIKHLGPALRKAGLRTRIWTYDHNFNARATADDAGIEYPATVLSDPEAARYTAGVAFHGYVGEPDGMTLFHERFPGVPIHFSEGSVFGLGGARTLVQYLRNWASSYNAWVTILDENSKPNNGPFPAGKTIVGLDSKTLGVDYRTDYFFYGQFMKFVERGAVRIGSDDPDTVAFRNPDGRIVLVAVSGDGGRDLRIAWGGRTARAQLPPRAVATFVWTP